MADQKCPCQHCEQHISFPTEMVDKTIEYPNCHLETRLFIPLKGNWQRAAEEKPARIETTLESIGEVFFCLCLILGLVISAGGVMLLLGPDAGQGQYLPGCAALAIGIAIIGQAFLFKTLLRALAEIIRILRASAPKP